MDQLEGFMIVGEEQKVCHLQRSIYGLKQASRSWNIYFNEVIRGYDFVKNDFNPCVYKKDLGDASYIFGIKIFRDKSKRILGMTQNSYVEKVLKRFKVEHSKRGFLPMRHGCNEQISDVCCGGALDCIQDIIKYLRRTKDVFLVYGGGELILEGFSDASFQSDDDDAKSQSGFVFKLNGGVVVWKSSKQDTTADSNIKVEYIATSKAAKEAVG
ncbi:UNVERIFIED_CONTAM: Secreted RxLR effector protein [Sesamum calycinum]|uniref:Secreted RxLR effector protein n=1 Tax=Sesamum calycinum TaxID=2727403 RepID=A0AAW2JFG5_9LAMI